MINIAFKSVLLFASILGAVSASAQNTFPPTGNVGIGTTTPATLLDVNGTLQAKNLNIFNNNVPGSYPVISIGRSYADAYYAIAKGNGEWVQGSIAGDLILRTVSGNFYVSTNNGVSSALTVSNSGNVGLGTSNPSSRFDILGGGDRTGSHLSNSSLYVTGTMSSGQIGSTTGNIEFRHDNGTQGIGFGYNTIYQTGSNPNQDLNFLSRGSGPITFNAYPYSSGNVGIGTPTPTERLSVLGNIVATNQNNGYVLFNPNDGGVEIASGNNEHSFIDFKGSANLSSDMQGRIAYNDNYGFDFSTSADYAIKMRINKNGNIGIGTSNPTEKLSVNGTILGKKMRVSIQIADWPDYVFGNSYKLRSLTSVENFIQRNKHLPGVPSAKDIEKKGLDIGSTQAVLLKKIEELTLYVIEQGKEIQKLKKIANHSR